MVPTVDIVDPETTTDWEPWEVSSSNSMTSPSDQTLATASTRSIQVTWCHSA